MMQKSYSVRMGEVTVLRGIALSLLTYCNQDLHFYAWLNLYINNILTLALCLELFLLLAFFQGFVFGLAIPA